MSVEEAQKQNVGWSQRRIARELGINRETVGRYLRLVRGAKPSISTPGFSAESESKPAILTPGVEGSTEAKPVISTAGKSVGRKSQCEPLAEVILAKVEVGLSAQRIYQDLVEENGFTDSYQSVKRFVEFPGRPDQRTSIVSTKRADLISFARLRYAQEASAANSRAGDALPVLLTRILRLRQ